MSDTEIVRDVLARATKETATKMLPVDVFLDASLALERLESQNQALQEENERLHKAYGRLVERLRLATPRSLMEVSDEALSPTQETDPEMTNCPACGSPRTSDRWCAMGRADDWVHIGPHPVKPGECAPCPHPWHTRPTQETDPE